MNRTKIEQVRSHLSLLQKAYPDFQWPNQGKQQGYPTELNTCLGDIRRFGFLRRKYELVFRTSNNGTAIETAEDYNTRDKKTIITYNPIRLETYGVWISV